MRAREFHQLIDFRSDERTANGIDGRKSHQARSIADRAKSKYMELNVFVMARKVAACHEN